tara:strand:+ start:1326 stop:1442 length:117 start_codon:yes stop_codon:yes gene_type:complete
MQKISHAGRKKTSGQADDAPVEKCVFSLMNNKENVYET